MIKKVAVFIDWENIRKGLFERATKIIKKKVDYNNPSNLMKLINSFILESQEEIFRVFLYLSRPLPYAYHNGQKIEFSIQPAYQKHKMFVESIGKNDYIALRSGRLKFRGYDQKKQPIFTQKQVDMLLGLDIAHISYRKLVDRILIFSCDTDIVPALKTARINGLQVIIAICPDVQQVDDELRLHSDFIREIKFIDIYP